MFHFGRLCYCSHGCPGVVREMKLSPLCFEMTLNYQHVMLPPRPFAAISHTANTFMRTWSCPHGCRSSRPRNLPRNLSTDDAVSHRSAVCLGATSLCPIRCCEAGKDVFMRDDALCRISLEFPTDNIMSIQRKQSIRSAPVPDRKLIFQKPRYFVDPFKCFIAFQFHLLVIFLIPHFIYTVIVN